MNDGPDLNLLRVFDALMRRRSVTSAAAELHLSQAATSNALERLRRALGDRLLERQGNRMVPTRFAEDLWPGVAAGLTTTNAALAAARRFDPAAATGRFRVGMHDYALDLLGPPLAAAIGQTAPGMTLELLAAGDPSADHALREGALDLVLRAGDRSSPGLVRQSLFAEDFVGLCAPSHPILKTLTLDLWLAHPHVLVSSRGRTQGNVDAALAPIGRVRRVGCTAPGFAAAAGVAAASGMILTAARRLADGLATRHGLARFELPLPVPGFELVMLWSRRDDPAPAHRWLRGVIAGLEP